MKFFNLNTLTIATTVLLCTTASSQDVTLPPDFGTIDLADSFQPDPQTIDVNAGGALFAGDLEFACNGYVSDAPSYRINFQAGASGLGIYTDSYTDTTLLINTPEGEWVCNDDNYNLEDFNAGYYFANPESGEYNIWVGTFPDVSGSSDATLNITQFPESDWLNNFTPSFTQGIYPIRVLNNGNEIQAGFATLVSENQMITNAGLVSQGDQWIVEDAVSGAELIANVNIIDEAAGLAILSVNGINGTPLTVAAEFPELSRNISLALLNTSRSGVLHSIVDDQDLLSQVRHTALTEEGEYGAALLNNCGEIIGLSQHSSPVLSSRLRPDQDFAFSTNLATLSNFLNENDVDFIEAFDVCLSEAEQLNLAEIKIQEQEEELARRLEEQSLLEEEQLLLEEEQRRLQEETERLQQEQETLAEENRIRLEELAAREAELEASLDAIEEAEARQEELEQQAQDQEEALAQAAEQQRIDDRNRLYQWTGFGVVLIALFGFVVLQVKRRNKIQEEAEESISEVKQKSEQIESELEKVSAEFPDIVLSGNDDHGAESRLKINGNALIRSDNGQIIGRSAQHADYVLNLDTVSRKHIRLFIKEVILTGSTRNKIFVEDLNSANGTAINDNQLHSGQEYELNSGDTLKIGLTTYSVNLLET